MKNLKTFAELNEAKVVAKKVVAELVHAPDASETTVWVGEKKIRVRYAGKDNDESFAKKITAAAKKLGATHINDEEADGEEKL